MAQALHPMLNTAIKAARAAGALINRASMDLDLLKVNTKSPNDFVTEVDQAAERVIIDTLLAAYPGHGAREHGVLCHPKAGRAQGLGDARGIALDDGAGRLGRDVARGETGAAAGQDEVETGGAPVEERLRDDIELVGDDVAPLNGPTRTLGNYFGRQRPALVLVGAL